MEGEWLSMCLSGTGFSRGTKPSSFIHVVAGLAAPSLSRWNNIPVCGGTTCGLPFPGEGSGCLPSVGAYHPHLGSDRLTAGLGSESGSSSPAGSRLPDPGQLGLQRRVGLGVLPVTPQSLIRKWR